MRTKVSLEEFPSSQTSAPWIDALEVLDCGVFPASEPGVRRFVQWLRETAVTEVDMGRPAAELRPTVVSLTIRRHGSGRLALAVGAGLDRSLRRRMARLGEELGVPLLLQTDVASGKKRLLYLEVDDGERAVVALHRLLRDVLGFEPEAAVGIGHVRRMGPACGHDDVYVDPRAAPRYHAFN